MPTNEVVHKHLVIVEEALSAQKFLITNVVKQQLHNLCNDFENGSRNLKSAGPVDKLETANASKKLTFGSSETPKDDGHEHTVSAWTLGPTVSGASCQSVHEEPSPIKTSKEAAASSDDQVHEVIPAKILQRKSHAVAKLTRMVTSALAKPAKSEDTNVATLSPRSEIPDKKKSVVIEKLELARKEKHKGCFADTGTMKQEVRQALHKKVYSVADYYYDTGMCQRIARSEYFDNITLGVILFNAIWIAVDTDENDAGNILDAEAVFQIVESLFCLYFLFEWTVRFLSFKNKFNGLKDAWFVFDTCLVGMMLAENVVMTLVFLITGGQGSAGFGNASILRIFRLLRLTRMSRLTRFIRLMPEVMVIIKGMSIACRSVFFTLVLLMCIIYVFAIAFVILSDGSDMDTHHQYFDDVPDAIATLLLQGTLPDYAEVVYNVSRESLALGFVYMLFILLASITLMNMLVGILVEVVAVVAYHEKEQLNATHVRNELYRLLRAAGIDADDPQVAMSREQVQDLLLTPEAIRAINDVGVDAVYLVDYCEFVFKSTDEVTFANFVEIVMQLHGENSATVKDVADLRKLIVQDLFAKLSRMEEIFLIGFQALDEEIGVSSDRLTAAAASGSLPGWNERPASNIRASDQSTHTIRSASHHIRASDQSIHSICPNRSTAVQQASFDSVEPAEETVAEQRHRDLSQRRPPSQPPEPLQFLDADAQEDQLLPIIPGQSERDLA